MIDGPSENQDFIDKKQIWDELFDYPFNLGIQGGYIKAELLGERGNVIKYINSDEFLNRVELFMKEMDDSGVLRDCISVENIKEIINTMLKEK